MYSGLVARCDHERKNIARGLTKETSIEYLVIISMMEAGPRIQYSGTFALDLFSRESLLSLTLFIHQALCGKRGSSDF